MRGNIDKWTAFWLSLCVPGAGQLGAGDASCVLWILAVAGVVATWRSLAGSAPFWFVAVGQFLSLCVVAAFSAAHARRILEPAGGHGGWFRGGAERNRARLISATSRGRSLRIGIEVETAMSLDDLWRRVARIESFLTIDPFHEQIILVGGARRAGTPLVLWHNAFGRRFAREGRILFWHEGRRYAVSDLSIRDRARGFPHVFFIEVAPLSASRSKLSIWVRGRWTSRFVPVAWGRSWVAAVASDHARLLCRAL